MTIQTLDGSYGCEVLLKITLTSCDALQAISLLCIIFLSHPIARKMFKALSFKKSSNSSHASLVSPKISRIDHHGSNVPISSWNEFVSIAQNSISDENFYTIESRIYEYISTSPDPTKKKFSSVPKTSSQHQHYAYPNRCHAIRDIMIHDKNNVSKKIPETPFTTYGTQPLPKNIPNQILDDVRLFDYYYNNLNSVFITKNPQTNNVDETDAYTKSRTSKLLR